MMKYPTHLNAPEAPTRTPTPTPWTVGPHPGNEAGTDWRTILASGEFGEGYIGEALQEHAALIVRAVNSHAALVAELQRLYEAARCMADPEHCLHGQRTHLPWRALADQARAALALAEEA